MKLEIVLCLLVCQVSSLYEYDYGSEQDDSKSELAKHFTSNSDHYYIRPLQSFSRDNLARNWGMGAGGPYEYNRNFWKGSRGIGWGFGPNPWMNMFLLGKQMKYTYSKDSPRKYKGPLTNGVLRRRQERKIFWEKQRNMFRVKKVGRRSSFWC